MPEFELAEADYESVRESANVVNVERPTDGSPKAKGKPPDWESDRKDLIESETPKGSARRKAREGEYEGSVRS
ncbi:hypothetical protein, partial [Streptomyces sp. NPDC004065]|uniref:hypothetical protein n=1 Tax=Streptomyces sp. NPDC004065 TaxID=3364689 RepID=UPI00384B5767